MKLLLYFKRDAKVLVEFYVDVNICFVSLSSMQLDALVVVVVVVFFC